MDPDAAADPFRRWLPAVLVLAAACRLALVLVNVHTGLFGDPADYERWAVSLATGHGFPSTIIATPGTPSAFRAPAYPLLLAGVYQLTGVHVTVGRALGAVLGVVVVAELAAVARLLAGPRVGLVAGLLAAVYPPLIALNGSLLSESLFLVLELAFVLALWRAWRAPGSVGWAALAGALGALAALTRAVGLPWVVIVALACVTAGAGAAPLRRRLLAAAAAVLAFALVLAPWTIRNVQDFHAFVPVSTEGGYTLAGQYNSTVAAPGAFQSVWQIPLIIPDVARRVRSLYDRPGGVNEVQLSAKLQSLAVDYARRHPGYVPRAIVNDTLHLFDLGPGHAGQTATVDSTLDAPRWLRTPMNVAAWVIGALALIGAVIAIARRRHGPWWVWGILVAVWLVTVPAVGTTLKRAPLDPFLIALAAIALEALRSRFARPGWASARSTPSP